MTTIGSPEDRIRPADANPAYFQYKGQPIVMLGGSVEDNLFQIPDIEKQLDRLQSAGGNYVRCTMSSRDEGDVWPFHLDPDSGLYDLNRFNDEYWRRFSRFLELTEQRDIIVQIEIWATFDFYRDEWRRNPFNPACNSTYTVDESGLPEVVDSHPVKTENPFFWTVPAEHDRREVLAYQRAFVDRLLSISLHYPNVLYCMDNETSVTEEWGKYWSVYIHAAAGKRGVAVQTSEMWDPHDLSHPWHARTLNDPALYTFIDISQNNHQVGQAHWDNMRAHLRRIVRSGAVRPATNVKIYGADRGRFGGDRDGQERFWRAIVGGCASARFHRPISGLGLNDTAVRHITSLRMFCDALDIFSGAPDVSLLTNRADNAAYCIANPGVEYGIFFPSGTTVKLDASALPDKRASVRWLDIINGVWHDSARVDLDADGRLTLTSPPDRFSAVIVRR